MTPRHTRPDTSRVSIRGYPPFAAVLLEAAAAAVVVVAAVGALHSYFPM
jgi:hypothetical protein